jgi:hypothetical protein
MAWSRMTSFVKTARRSISSCLPAPPPPDATVEEQTLWGFTRLERFEAMTNALVSNKQHAGWFQSVNVLTGPNQNGTQSVKFQRVLKIIKHASSTQKVDYEILTDEGDTYFTRQTVAANSAQTVIYSAESSARSA